MKKQVNTGLYIGVGVLLIAASLLARSVFYLPLGCCFVFYGLAHRQGKGKK